MTCPVCSSGRNCQNILTTTTKQERKTNKCDKFCVSTWIRIATRTETLRQILLHSPPHALTAQSIPQRNTESRITIYNITNYHILWIWDTIHDTVWKIFTSTEWKGVAYIETSNKLAIMWDFSDKMELFWNADTFHSLTGPYFAFYVLGWPKSSFDF